MTSLLWILLGVVLVPVFVASRRVSLAGLSAQGLLLGCLALSSAHAGLELVDLARLADLIAVRAVMVPVVLGSALRARGAPSRVDLVPPSILWWTAVLGATLASFEFANLLVPAAGPAQVLAGVASSMVLVAFLILSTQTNVLAQMIAALHIENAVALVELEETHAGLVFLVVQTLTLIATIALFRWYLSSEVAAIGAGHDAVEERVP